MSRLPTGTVTMLFTDIEGSTRLLADSGERYQAILASTIECCAGRSSGTADSSHHPGDGFFAVFTRAEAAVAAAAERELAGSRGRRLDVDAAVEFALS